MDIVCRAWETICSCWSPVLSNHLLLDIPGVGGLVFNTKFTYLTLYDVTQHF